MITLCRRARCLPAMPQVFQSYTDTKQGAADFRQAQVPTDKQPTLRVRDLSISMEMKLGLLTESSYHTIS